MPGLIEGLSMRVVARLPRGRYRDLINDELLSD